MDLIENINKNFPSDLSKNPFKHILCKFMNDYGADFGSFLGPNFSERKWQIKTWTASKDLDGVVTDITELDLETQYIFKKNTYKEPDIWSKIEKGICNVALCLKKIVFIDDVKNTPCLYVEQYKDVKHEIAIPLIHKYESTEDVIGCIVLDFINTEKYKDSCSSLKKQKDIELELGNLVIIHLLFMLKFYTVGCMYTL
ncbi:MAG: hypothetical protein GY795_12005 [Desulfobacterales bacterium]|nr:hypothetical protein [Desulfobacterales bacterium]